MTILLTPFMSCSAKLPIYALFTYAFFPKYRALVMVGLYFTGIIVGVLFSLLLKNTAFQGEPVPFVMELPNYRLPSLKSVGMLIWDKAKDFITKAFTIIFMASIVIWFLQTFDVRLNVVVDSKDSLLALIGGFAAPVFVPLGFGDWRISTALITGFTAKESVVSTLTVLFGGDMSALNTLSLIHISQDLPKELKYCIISIVKEALSNVTRHSDADRVKLLLREHPAFYQILIQDNGKCVHPGDGTGIGITNMRQRVETFGGTIDIRTENGYRIFIHIPKADIPAGR